MNSDIERERSKRTFNPDDVTSQLYGKNGLHSRRLAQKRAAEDPELKSAEDIVMMSHEEAYSEAVRIFSVTVHKSKEYGYTKPSVASYSKGDLADEEVLAFYKEAAFIDTVHPFGLHESMFIPTLESQATDEQKDLWLPQARNLEIIGTYAQTEMGHGTFLRGLETTATYDKQSQQFVLHSPTVSSMKFWPGGLGKTANYAIVMAQLVIDGKSYGMHAFMTPLRDLSTHQPLPGIEIGDINTKFGYDNMDNGFLKFNQYRIPRKNMLMKYAKVTADGVYSREGVPQIAYLSMVLIRMLIVLGSSNDLAMASTIATRYSAVRRQTANSQGVEPQVLDYLTQQQKVMPAMASAYALFFTGFTLRDIYHEIHSSLSSGDTSRLAEIHCLTSCLKAYAAEICHQNVEICRQACGGHGFSNASGIPKIYMRTVPACTYEGENTVMYLQCARSLLKFFGMAQAEKPLPQALKFLAEPHHIPLELKNASKFDFTLYLLAFKLNALSMITHVAGRMQDAIYSESVDPEAAWNDNSIDLVATAKNYAMYLTVTMFTDSLRTRDWEPSAQAVMSLVCELYMVHSILLNAGLFLQNGVLTPAQVDWMSSRRVELLKELRPNAVTLVDAFDYPDRLLNSCLGRYDGQVYDALYEFAKKSSLNKNQVHPTFEKYIKPLRQSLKSKL